MQVTDTIIQIQLQRLLPRSCAGRHKANESYGWGIKSPSITWFDTYLMLGDSTKHQILVFLWAFSLWRNICLAFEPDFDDQKEFSFCTVSSKWLYHVKYWEALGFVCRSMMSRFAILVNYSRHIFNYVFVWVIFSFDKLESTWARANIPCKKQC